jgi:hypothetical protein
MKAKLILFLVFALLLVPGVVNGLGVMPASNTIIVDGSEKEFVLRVVNSEKKDFSVGLSVEGELSSLVSLSKERIVFLSDTPHDDIRVRVSPPPPGLSEGVHTIRVRLTSIESRGGDVSARLGVSFRLDLVVPYSDAFIDVNLFAPNFDVNKHGNFVLQAENRGIRNAVNVVPVIDIYSANEKLLTITGEAMRVDSGSSVNFVLPLREDLPSGRYSARASVVYPGGSNEDEKSFSVGTPRIAIDSISSSDFRLGGVAGFDMLLRSEWAQEIRGVYADVEFKRAGALLHEARSASVNMPGFGRSIVPVYWDTSGLGPGRYDMRVSLHYLDKVDSEDFDVVLETDRARVVGVGQVVAGTKEDDGIGVLVIIILLLVLVNGFLVYWFAVRRKATK